MKQSDIKIIRKKLKLTQKGFAKKIGISFATVNRWEKGHNRPSKLALRQIKELIEKIKKLDKNIQL